MEPPDAGPTFTGHVTVDGVTTTYDDAPLESFFSDDAFVPDDGTLVDPGGTHHVGVLADDACLQVGLGADKHVVVHDGSMQERAAFDYDVASEDGEFSELDAGLDLGVVTDEEWAAQHRVGMDVGALGDPHTR